MFECFRLSVILFFNIDIDNGEMVLTFAQRTLTSGPVLAICVDNTNKLLTVEGSEDAMVVIYSLDKDHEGHLRVSNRLSKAVYIVIVISQTQGIVP